MTTASTRRATLPDPLAPQPEPRRSAVPSTLTAPPTSRPPVPNHLLDSETFSKVTKNDAVVASPSVVHFGGFVVGRVHVRKLDLVNCSPEVQRYHIVAPQTRFFKIKYTKGDRLIPGLALRVEINFIPDEWRYYYDCLRIHCRCGDNLVIPIHGYPTLDDAAVPKSFTFSPTPIGIQQTKVVPLRSPHPVSFEFRVSIIEGNPAFAVQPMEGLVPARGEARINVIFTPIAFVTASMKMMIETSQFNSKPHVCVFAGQCRPGLASGNGPGIKGHSRAVSTLDPNEIKPLEIARKRRQLTKVGKVSFRGRVRPPSAGSESTASETEKDGVLFPRDLNNPQAVCYVLNQRPGRMTAKQLRDVISQASSRKKSAKASRARKEALFVGKINDLQAEERANQLRWMTKLGEEAMTPRSKEEVTEDRQTALELYKQKRGDPSVDDEIVRNSSVAQYKRIKRGVDRPQTEHRPRTEETSATLPGAMAEPTHQPKFDHYKNEPWRLKNRALFLFNQGARKVLIQNRADRNLAKMRRFKEAWKAGRMSVENVSVTTAPEERVATPPVTQGAALEAALEEGFAQKEEEKKVDVVIEDLEDVDKATEILETKVDKLVPSVIIPDVICAWSFPEYVAPNYVDDMSGKALGYVPYRITEVEVHSQTPYFNLKAPQQNRILTYHRHSTQDAATNYVAPERRSLREGAHEELASGIIDPEDRRRSSQDPTLDEDFDPASIRADLLKMPEFLDEFKYPPIEVFNAAPGLVRFRKTLPYSETDLDFHLNPIPPHPCRHDISTASTHCATQRAFIDPDDVVPGVMTWKRYVRHGLAATTQTPSLSSVWMPRWTDPYLEDMAPRKGPKMKGPPESEEEEEEEKAEEGKNEGKEEKLPSRALTAPPASAPATAPPTASASAVPVPQIVASSMTLDSIREHFPLIPQLDIPPAPSMMFDSQMQLTSGATGAPGDTSQTVGGAPGVSQAELSDSSANFPYSRTLPKSYVPLAPTGGLISRDQRLRELNMFVLSKYNQLGRRVDENLETMNGLLTDPSLRLERRRKRKSEEVDDFEHEDSEEALKPLSALDPPIIVTDSAASQPQ